MVFHEKKSRGIEEVLLLCVIGAVPSVYGRLRLIVGR